MDIGPGTEPADDDSVLVLVDRLGAAGTDRAAARAHDRVRRAVAAGAVPPGVRRIAEGLSAPRVGELPPPPRRPADDPGSVVAGVRDNPLLVFDDVDPAAVAVAVGALVDDGLRVVVTGADLAALDAVCSALPAGAADRVVDGLPALAPSELRRLRTLLATSTPSRRARPAQQLPDPAVLPDLAEVEALCAVADHPAPPGADVVATVLGELDPERRTAVTAVAHCVRQSLAALGEHDGPWVRELLADLVHGRRRPAFERLVQSAAQALGTLDDGRDDPPVQLTGPLPADAVDTLVSYLDYLEGGGRARSYFRPAVQREVGPVLRLLRIGGRQPETAEDLRIVLTHFELGERLSTVDADCAEVDLPTPRNPAELAALSEALVAVAAAARSVGVLRHDVLFLHPGSPVAVPDVEAAEQLASAVLDYADHGSVAEAGARLDAKAAALEALAPAEATAPEHARAVAALRARDARAYAVAAEELAAARRELLDERLTAALLVELGSPALARAWTSPGGAGPVRSGLVWVTPAERLLEQLPPADRADVVVVLDAGRLGVDRALLAAAAPRVVATAAPGARSGGATLLGLLLRASALVIRGRPAGGPRRVLPLTAGARQVPLPGRGEVEQAGA